MQFPDTPAAQRLAALFDALESRSFSADWLTEATTQESIDRVGMPALIHHLERAADSFPAGLSQITLSEPHRITGRAIGKDGAPIEVECDVEAQAPHRMSGFDVTPLTKHVCLIPDARRLLTDAGSLPFVWARKTWFPYDVGAISEAVRERYGWDVSVVRHVSSGEVEACELELLQPADGAVWLEDGDEAIAHAWFKQQEAPAKRRSPWEYAGWRAGAEAWIRDRLPMTSEIVQYKAGWGGSCVLKVTGGEGVHYFKAAYDKPPREVDVICELARRWPRNVPTLAAFDEVRGWILVPEYPFDFSLTLEQKRGAVREYGRIQRAEAEHKARWLDLGCPHWTARDLPELLAAAAARRDLDVEDDVVQRLSALAEELSDSPIPDSLVHLDFRQGNLGPDGSTFVYYDWSDAVWACPLFSPIRFMDYMPGDDAHDAGERREVRDAALEPWIETYGAKNVRRTFDLCWALQGAFLAIRWDHDANFFEEGSPWHAVISKPSHDVATLVRRVRALDSTAG